MYKNLESVLVNFLNDDKYFSSNKVCERNIKLFRRSKKTIEYYYLPSQLEIFKVLMKGKQIQSFSDILNEVESLALNQRAMIH